MRAAPTAAALSVALRLSACAVLPETPQSGDHTLVVTRGDLTPAVILQGELDAVEASVFIAPRTPQWNIAIKWMVEDGASVQAGDPVVEFDTSSVGATLLRLQSELRQEGNARLAQDAGEQVSAIDRDIEVRRKELVLEKAQALASIDEASLSRRTLQERRLEVRRGEVEVEAAREGKTAGDRGASLLAEVGHIDIETKLRQQAASQADLEALTLRAPVDGIIQIADHPWESRRLDIGDDVGPGTTLAKLPDLRKMQVKGALFDVDDGAVQAGQEAVVTLDAWPDRSFNGRVREVAALAREPYQGSLRRTFVVWVDLLDADPTRMRPGMSARIEVRPTVARGVLLAPRQAIDLLSQPPRARTAGGSFVDIEVGLCDPHRCEVKAGLEEGDNLLAIETRDDG